MSKNLFKTNGNDYKKAAFDFCEEYKNFISTAKTERLCAEYFRKRAEENGFMDLKKMKNPKPGDKVYYINRDRSAIFAVIGQDAAENGLNLVAAHIDSPRLDLKPSPVTQEGNLAYFRTHYYGGIKKYQWVTIPLAMYGVVFKTDGTRIDIAIGDGENDPAFTVTDLLPHLATNQVMKKMTEGITGEKLMILAGSDEADDDKEAVKQNLLNILKEKYDICEEDFYSAEIQVVPAGRAYDVGFDRSMIGGYGQDDRVCAYTAFMGLLDTKTPQKTAVVLLADREEVGSMGNSGMQSRFLQYFIEEVFETSKMNTVLKNTYCLSSDVTATYDPLYPEVYEAQNSSKAGEGISLMRYTGSRGKGGSSEASAEFTAKIRAIFEKNNVSYQFAELGKVDEGGGGTVAQYIANLGADVIDAGVALLCMHSPFEIAHKADIYETYKAFSAFLK